MRITPIEGFPGYCIRDDGAVLSYWRTNGRIGDKAIIRKLTKTKRGYLQITLCRNGVRINKQLHRLLAIAFIPNPDHLPYVLHADDDLSNIALSNLRWGTPSDNNNDAHLNRQIDKGIPVGHAKLTKNQVFRIREQYASGSVTQQNLANEYGVSQVMIGRIVRCKNWAWL